MPAYTQYVSINNFGVQPTMGDMISAVRNAFLSCSFTRTTQSGSVDNPYSLGVRSAGNEQATYDIFAFNDSWQATRPLFIKVDYGSGASAQAIRLDFQMGTAHNSSGSLTGISTLLEVSGTQLNSVTPTSGSPIFASGDGSYMTLLTFPDTTHNNQIGVFERLYDNNGIPTGSGFHMFCTNDALTSRLVYSQAAPWGQAPAPQESSNIPNSRPTLSPSTYNGRLILGLIYPMIGFPQNPSPNVLIGNSTDLAQPLQTFPYTVYGQQRIYRNAGSNFTPVSAQIYTNGRWAVRAE